MMYAPFGWVKEEHSLTLCRDESRLLIIIITVSVEIETDSIR